MNFPGRFLRFGCVGGLAMLLHLLVVSLLVPAGLDPLLANAAGFLAAFQLSFHGHRRWTFRAGPEAGQYARMFAVSSLGFLANETLYAALLRARVLDYRASLALVLAAVAAGTYLLSRFWVFRKS